MSHDGLHEPISELTDEVRDMHRAIVSLQEELEAVDWYHQRATATKNDELRGLLEHNRDEEMEHAAMTLEWIRRNSPAFDRELRDWLFTDKPFHHGPEAHSTAEPHGTVQEPDEGSDDTAATTRQPPQRGRRVGQVGSLKGLTKKGGNNDDV